RGALADLEAWCHTAPAFSGFLVGGRGGAGKTRLGVELCSKLGDCGWLAGLLVKGTDLGGLEALVQVPTARLVVVDYAETRVAAAYLRLVDPDNKPSNTAELMQRLLDHEDLYWKDSGPAPSDPQLRCRVVALGTLAGAASEDEAAGLLGLIPDLADASAERRF